jgi:hypothetical protein
VQMIRSKVANDLDLFTFYSKLAQIRDTINSNQEHRLKANKDIPLTSIYDKRIILDKINYQYDQYGRFYSNIFAHQLSSKDQWRLYNAEDIKLEDIFDKKYLQSVYLAKPDPS